MAKKMRLTAAVCLLLALLFSTAGAPPALTITAGTAAYHFWMRLAVGAVYNRAMKNRADLTCRRYRLRRWEPALYEALGVKRWKGRMPSYDPSLFSPRLHTWEEIAQAMCQAELVHETIVVLSFAPVLLVNRLGGAAAFWITSVCAAAVDLSFVVLQRYNRPRILRLIKKTEGRR